MKSINHGHSVEIRATLFATIVAYKVSPRREAGWKEFPEMELRQQVIGRVFYNTDRQIGPQGWIYLMANGGLNQMDAWWHPSEWFMPNAKEEMLAAARAHFFMPRGWDLGRGEVSFVIVTVNGGDEPQLVCFDLWSQQMVANFGDALSATGAIGRIVGGPLYDRPSHDPVAAQPPHPRLEDVQPTGWIVKSWREIG